MKALVARIERINGDSVSVYLVDEVMVELEVDGGLDQYVLLSLDVSESQRLCSALGIAYRTLLCNGAPRTRGDR